MEGQGERETSMTTTRLGYRPLDKVGNAGESVKGREKLAGHDEAGAALGGTTPLFPGTPK